MNLVVATDLDGTIAFAHRPPARTVLDALDRVCGDLGARLIIATARSPRVLGEWFAGVAAPVSAVCCNGALVTSGGIERHRAAVPPAVVDAVLGELDRTNSPYCLEYGDGFVESAPGALPWMGESARRALQPGGPDIEGVVKLCVGEGRRLARRLVALAGGSAEVLPHETGDADVVAAGVNKANGLARLTGEDDLVLALGNDLNDLELLRSADRAVVVGSGLVGVERLGTVRRIAPSPDAVAEAIVAEATALAATEAALAGRERRRA